MNKIFLPNIGDLAEIQRASYFRFLYQGIESELSKLPNPLITSPKLPLTKIGPYYYEVLNGNTYLEIYSACYANFYVNDIRLKLPRQSIEDALKEDITYSIKLYVPCEYKIRPKKLKFNSLKKINRKFLQKSLLTVSSNSKTNFSIFYNESVNHLFISDLNFEKNENVNLKKITKNKNKTKILIEKFRFFYIKQEILFGEIPLMTDDGTFIINGCERIVVNQIIRSPGIHFKKEFNSSNKTTYMATLISDRGSWTKFILDQRKKRKVYIEDQSGNISIELEDPENDRFYIRLNEFKERYTGYRQRKEDLDTDKLYLFELLYLFGLSTSEIYDSLKYPDQFSYSLFDDVGENEQKDEKLKDLVKDIEEFYPAFRKQYFSHRRGCFSIGQIGRYQVNKKLGLNLPKEITYLTVQDIFGIIDSLIELKYYNRIPDDIDHIKNKQVRSVGELLQNQLRIALSRVQKSLGRVNKKVGTISLVELKNKEKPTRIYYYENLKIFEKKLITFDTRIITNTFKEFFNSSPISQYMDQINPLSELTQKRRISVFGPNGLKRENISTVIRDIHPSHYGKICPVETPEGLNAGLVTSLSLFARLNSIGWLETPYFIVKKGKVFSSKRPIFLNPEEESETKIAFADILVNKDAQIEPEYVAIKENYSFSSEKSNEINLLTISPLQILSVATTLIPFVEHDDANRALMGSNMQRQAVPLIYTEKPIIGTGLEVTAIIDSGMILKNYAEGTVIYSDFGLIKIKDSANQIIQYFLTKYTRSNQETCINQKPIVFHNEKVFSGQIIADGPATEEGEIALGKNLTIAYMPWEGYNYEDAIIINERIITQDCLTSIHINEYETSLDFSLSTPEILTNKVAHAPKASLFHLSESGIARIGSYVKENDILVGKIIPGGKDESPQGKLYEALFGSDKAKKRAIRDVSLRVAAGTEGKIVDIRVFSSPEMIGGQVRRFYKSIKIYIAQIRKVQIGDKLAGRHGNKGIISRILPRQDMPYLPDGVSVDIIFNPLGVPSRMNVGQVLECLLGLAGEKLGTRFKILPFDEIYGKEASRILVNQKLKEAALKTNCDWLYSVENPGKILLRDGRTGEYFDNPVTVGKSYILKLIHLVEDKIHARCVGPYSMITEQPLSGKAHEGGQRFGEMEVWALEAYGCSSTLQELLTIKSDDIDGRNDMYEALIVREKIRKPNPSLPEGFLLMVRELQSLGLDFILKKTDEGFYSTMKMVEINRDLFKDIENRLYLRTTIERKKWLRPFKNESELLDEKQETTALKKKKKRILKN